MKSTVTTLIVALFLFGSCSSSDSKDNQTADTTQATDITTDNSAPGDTTTDNSTPGDTTTLPDSIESDINAGSDLVIHTCCTVDDDCEQDMVCVIRQGETEGVCYWPASGNCYTSQDCDQYYVCIGAEFPLCADGVVPTRGYCSPLDAGSCTTDDDCPTGTHCVGEAMGGGTCLPDLTNSYCWEDEECLEGQRCYGQYWCGAADDCADPNSKGGCQDAAWVDCVEQYSGCGCEEGCMDGFGITVWYPASAGNFDEAIDPPQELLDVAVAKYVCAICSCEESWSFLQDNELQPLEEGGAEGFCTELLKYQEECDNCLTTWFGGCC